MHKPSQPSSMAFKQPRALYAGKWRLRLLLTLLSLSGAALLEAQPSGGQPAEPPFLVWVWKQLQGQLGGSLVKLQPGAESLQEAHLLCMTQVHADSLTGWRLLLKLGWRSCTQCYP